MNKRLTKRQVRDACKTIFGIGFEDAVQCGNSIKIIIDTDTQCESVTVWACAKMAILLNIPLKDVFCESVFPEAIIEIRGCDIVDGGNKIGVKTIFNIFDIMGGEIVSHVKISGKDKRKITIEVDLKEDFLGILPAEEYYVQP